jgi:hypothetical protein
MTAGMNFNSSKQTRAPSSPASYGGNFQLYVHKKSKIQGTIGDKPETPELFPEVADDVPCNRCGYCVSLLREPEAGNPHIRFDEREQEPESCQTGLRRRSESYANCHRETTATAPVLDSTQLGASTSPLMDIRNRRQLFFALSNWPRLHRSFEFAQGRFSDPLSLAEGLHGLFTYLTGFSQFANGALLLRYHI